MSKAMYFDEIKNLVELQKVDDQRFLVKQEIQNAPKEIEALTKKFEQIDGRRSHILEKIAHIQEQQKRIAYEIDDDSAKIKKSKNKLMQVGNTREYQAVMREMDTMEKNNRSREEEKTVLMDELQIQNSALGDIESDHAAIKEELAIKQEGLKEKLEIAQKSLDELDKHRADASQKISRPVFMRYEFIRSRLEHPVIVAVKNGVCSGCHIAVPPQTYIELQRGQQILSCPNCQRLIFWNEHFSVADEEKAESSSSGEETQAETVTES